MAVYTKLNQEKIEEILSKYSFKKSPSSITNEIVSSSECSQHLNEDHYDPLGKVMLEYARREGSKDFREVKWLNSSVSKRSK